MKTIHDTIRSFGGRLSPEGFSILCLAIYDARLCQPLVPQMKTIWADLRPQVHKSTSAVAKALERAVFNLWVTGDRDVFASYQRSWCFEPPKPKEFVAVMAQALWDGADRSRIAG